MGVTKKKKSTPKFIHKNKGKLKKIWYYTLVYLLLSVKQNTDAIHAHTHTHTRERRTTWYLT